MTGFPKIVVHKLRREDSVSPHPDANILAAFSERALPGIEHETVLRHLAHCSECRQVVVLALPEAEIERQISFNPARHWFSAAVLRWGAVGIAVVIAFVALGMHERTPQETAKIAPFSRVQNGKAPANTVSRNEALPPATGMADASKLEPGQTPVAGRDKKALAREATALLAKAKSAPVPPIARGVSNRVEPGTNGPAQPMAREQIQASAAPAPQPFSASRGDVVRAKPAQASAAAQVRAAAPPPFAMTASRMRSSNLLQSGGTIWQVSRGSLQRSLDGGKDWSDVAVTGMTLDQFSANNTAKEQSASARPVFLVVTSIQSDVWAGGTETSLYRSTDAGAHWSRVVPTAQGSALTGDVNAIRFSDPEHGIISTSTSETWTTSDGGQSWQKQ